MFKKNFEKLFLGSAAKKSRGLTIIEMLLVISIMAIIMMVLIPRVGQLVKKVGQFRVNRVLQDWNSRITQYQLDTGMYPEKLADLWNRPSGHASVNWQGYVEKDEIVPPVDPAGVELGYNKPPMFFKDRYDHYELFSIGNQSEENPDKEKFIAYGR